MNKEKRGTRGELRRLIEDSSRLWSRERKEERREKGKKKKGEKGAETVEKWEEKAEI